jgi:hypothetical protein
LFIGFLIGAGNLSSIWNPEGKKPQQMDSLLDDEKRWADTYQIMT